MPASDPLALQDSTPPTRPMVEIKAAGAAFLRKEERLMPSSTEEERDVLLLELTMDDTTFEGNGLTLSRNEVVSDKESMKIVRIAKKFIILHHSPAK